MANKLTRSNFVEFAEFASRARLDDKQIEHLISSLKYQFNRDVNGNKVFDEDKFLDYIEALNEKRDYSDKFFAEQEREGNYEPSDMLDDGQTFYNHHEANDSWQK